jgi:hypothetical protein
MELGINFVVTERVWTSFESNMNSSVPATAQCHYTQGCSRMKTQSLHEERHENRDPETNETRCQRERD